MYETTYNQEAEHTKDLPNYEHLHVNNPCNAEDVAESSAVQSVDKSNRSKGFTEDSFSHDKGALEDESGDVELGNFLFEDASPNDVVPSEVVKLQKKEKLKELSSGKNLEKLEGIWKKVGFVCNVFF